VNTIHSMIMDDWRVFAKKIAETLAISWERVGCTINEILDIWKLSYKLVPIHLNALGSMIASMFHKPFWTNFGGDPVKFFNCLITMDKT
jgi:hypothetical protein